MTSLLKTWKRHWKGSPRYAQLRSIDKLAPSKKFLGLIKGLDRCQASLLTQLRMGHISLNRHLFHIHKVESPVCPHCQGLTVKSVRHVLLDCLFYAREQHILQLKAVSIERRGEGTCVALVGFLLVLFLITTQSCHPPPICL